MACNAVSSAHIQDWLSVKIMKERRMIPADSVIIPGHSADFLEGSHLPESFFNSPEISKAQLYKEIFKRHYSLWKTKDLESQAVFGKRIDAVLAAPEMLSNTEAASLFDNWDYQERQAKFIVNSVRAYEFWGYDWRLPLWDHELMDFWAEVPLPYKHQRNLWHSYQALYLPVQIPVFSHFSYSIRIRDKVLRQVVGNINDIRYGRFTPYQNPCQYATVKVQSLLDPVLQYPEYIKPGKPLLKCDLNAIQALISLL
jgi:asparagine synthetase B (glutamine-hydrolysing)